MDKLKPLLIVKPGTVSRKDINRAEQHGGICIIEIRPFDTRLRSVRLPDGTFIDNPYYTGSL